MLLSQWNIKKKYKTVSAASLFHIIFIVQTVFHLTLNVWIHNPAFPFMFFGVKYIQVYQYDIVNNMLTKSVLMTVKIIVSTNLYIVPTYFQTCKYYILQCEDGLEDMCQTCVRICLK